MTISNHANSSSHLKSDLLNTEIAFLSSAQSDSNALTAFSTFWDNLNARIEAAADSFTLDEETRLAAQSVSNNIAILAESFLSLHLAENEILSGHMSEVDEILRGSQETSHATSIPRHAPAASLRHIDCTESILSQKWQHCDGSPSDYPSSTLFARETSRWLLKHLHNPYPSQKAKLQMVRGFDATMKSITDWFTHARRRIGWTKICKQRFQGNRHLTTDYAWRILKQSATSSTYASEIALEFWEMKATAERLFGEKAVGELAKKLGDVENANHKRRGDNRSSYKKEQQGYKRKRSFDVSDDETDTGSDANFLRPPLRRAGDASKSEVILSTKRHRPDDGEGKTCIEEHLGALSPESLARSTSFTFSASSRDSTEELSTPSASVADLPYYIPSDIVDGWLSSIAPELPSCDSEGILIESRKRCISESSTMPPSKRHCQMGSNASTSEVSTFSYPPSLQTSDMAYGLLSQFDFDLPPPATIANIVEDDALHLSIFDCSYWQGTCVARSPLDVCDDIQVGATCSDSGSIHEWIDGILNPLPSKHSQHQAVSEQEELNDDNNPSGDSCFYEGSDSKQDNSNSFADSDQLSISGPFSSGPFSGAPSENACPAQQTDLDVQHEWMGSNSLQNQNLAKLERLNLLLAEAAKLQQEVFG